MLPAQREQARANKKELLLMNADVC